MGPEVFRFARKYAFLEEDTAKPTETRPVVIGVRLEEVTKYISRDV